MPVFLLYKCKTPEPGILSLFRIIHRLRIGNTPNLVAIYSTTTGQGGVKLSKTP
ncbi:hypothetical protein T4D_5604 [Trichinella pseudospiralis]|uniref:Uncharacterized protein n=1 Tax=Trichinella pseudospiralis TaxID=6337 RepID=A0A0V1F3F5_TRIPS|nr:hypothetical protein T4D_5604 [Trichinella pseudospiralis]